MEDDTSEKKEKVDRRIGAQFWKARSRHGRKPIFESPEMLWESCEDYFQWVEDNPLLEEKGFAFQGVVTKEMFCKMRAMTIGGLCIFLDITQQTWGEYRKKEDFSDVITRAEEIIRDQKFSGAAADLLNANIIARDLGLKDNINNEHSGLDGNPIETKTTHIVNASIVKEILEKLKDGI